MISNIEKFNYLVGVVFVTLYKSFPIRSDIDYINIIESQDLDFKICHGDSKSQGETLFLHETLHWLKATGYLIGSVELTPGGYSAALTLSPKGLEILKAIPDSINQNNNKSIGQELTEAFDSAAKSKVGDIAEKAMSYLFKIGWGSINEFS